MFFLIKYGFILASNSKNSFKTAERIKSEASIWLVWNLYTKNGYTLKQRMKTSVKKLPTVINPMRKKGYWSLPQKIFLLRDPRWPIFLDKQKFNIEIFACQKYVVGLNERKNDLKIKHKMWLVEFMCNPNEI